MDGSTEDSLPEYVRTERNCKYKYVMGRDRPDMLFPTWEFSGATIYSSRQPRRDSRIPTEDVISIGGVILRD